MSDKVSLRIVWVFEQLFGLASSEIFDSRESSDVNFDPVDVSVLILPSESMSSIFMHVAITIRRTPITEVNHILVATLIVVGNEVPEVVGTL